MKLLKIFSLLVLLSISCNALALEFTDLKQGEKLGESLINLNIEGKYTLTVADDYGYWIDVKETPYFGSKLYVFEKSYEANEEHAHMLHFQIISLTKEGQALIKTAADYIAIVEASTKKSRDSYKSQAIDKRTIAGREFEGIQYVSTINGNVEEGAVFVTKVGTQFLVLRAQELNEYRSSLGQLIAYASTLVEGVENADTDPLS